MIFSWHSKPKFLWFVVCFQLNLTSELCGPPSAASSALSRAAQTLLETQAGTDMVFEVFEAGSGSVSRFPAHRVIVAARCDWFRRALLSGKNNSNLFPQLLWLSEKSQRCGTSITLSKTLT